MEKLFAKFFNSEHILDTLKDKADKIEITRVHQVFDADTFFPEIDFKKWNLIFEEFHSKDATHQFDFSYQTYINKKHTR